MVKEKKEDFEIKLYELLGVKVFRSLVFKLEKLIHKKDKRKNINYHIKRINIDELESFKKYLYYNGFIHTKNSIIIFGMILFNIIMSNYLIFIVLIPELIRNLYCVMLQRYNYIKINQSIHRLEKVIERKEQRRRSEFEKNKSLDLIEKKNLLEYVEKLERLKRFIQGEDDLVLNEDYKEVLLLVQEYLKLNIKKQNLQTEDKDDTIQEEDVLNGVSLKMKRSDNYGYR